jgi:hypothetical protein
VNEDLERVRLAIGLSVAEVWLDAYALGSHRSPAQLADAMDGATSLSPHERSIVAMVLNEAAHDLGRAERVPIEP